MGRQVRSGVLFACVIAWVGCNPLFGIEPGVLVDQRADAGADHTTPDGAPGDSASDDTGAPGDAKAPDDARGDGGVCSIGGTLYSAGEANPNDLCQSCQPSTSTTAWSDPCRTEGGTCHAGTCTKAPSCAPGGAGMSTCGAGGSGAESCCTSPRVPGGTFFRGYTNTGNGPTYEGNPATLSPFRLDKYPVTVGRFRQFLKAFNAGTWKDTVTAGSGKHAHLNEGKGLEAAGAPGTHEPGWVLEDDDLVAPSPTNLQCDTSASWTSTIGDGENRPMTCVNWYEAAAFCIWDGGFLPSEAELEFAEAGGAEQRKYPWGSTDPGTACPGTGCDYAIYGCYYPSGSGTCGSVLSVAPVGYARLGVGRWGQMDLVGNVWAWNLDRYDTPLDPCNDCANVSNLAGRVIRGGAFWFNASVLLSVTRYNNQAATNRGSDAGVRCARSP
jgi:formylglycine-generating enzyme